MESQAEQAARKSVISVPAASPTPQNTHFWRFQAINSFLEDEEKLLKNYWKRVENFMIQVPGSPSTPSKSSLIGQMVENPIKAQEYKKSDFHSHKFRDENPQKFLGNALFIIKGFKNEKNRIQVGKFFWPIFDFL